MGCPEPGEAAVEDLAHHHDVAVVPLLPAEVARGEGQAPGQGLSGLPALAETREVDAVRVDGPAFLELRQDLKLRLRY